MAPHCPSIAGIIALLANLMRLVSDPVFFGPVYEAIDRNVPTSTDTSIIITGPEEITLIMRYNS